MGRRGGRRGGRRRSKRRSTRSKSKASKSKKKSRRRSTASSRRKSVRSKAKAKRTARKKKAKATKSKKRTTKKKTRSTAASKRRKVRSVAKAARAAKRTAKTSTSSSTSSSSKNKTKKKNSLRNKLKNKIASKTLKGKLAAKGITKKTVADKKKTISASQSRRQVRQKTKEKIATRKKLTIRGALGRLTRPASALASNIRGKPQSKLQRQLSNLKNDIAQKSTKEARFNRRADRLKKQFGLDTRDMRDLKINASVEKALGSVGLGWANKFLPKGIRDYKRTWSLGGKFRSPHKLGVRDGYRRPNTGGLKAGGVKKGLQIGRRDPTESLMSTDNTIRSGPKSPLAIQQAPVQKPKLETSKRDWLSDLYSSHNISGGKVGQPARDYWSNEAKTKGIDAVIQSIIGTSKAEGTYGGRRERDHRLTTGVRIGTESSAWKKHKRKSSFRRRPSKK